MKSVGSWTIVCDVAGRVTRNVGGNPLVTVAAVAVPREVRNALPGRLIRGFGGEPVKWSVGGLDGLSLITRLVFRYALPVLIRKVYRADAWQRFWRDGDEFGKRLESIVGERTRYLASDAIMKTILFIGAFGALVGQLLAMRRVPEVARSDRRLGIELSLINDTDIEDPETRSLFASYVEDWPNVTGFMAEIGIEPRTTVHFAREQDEPLLLLPDYLAGAFHHADDRAGLSKPVARPDDVRAVIEPFSRRHGRLLLVQDGDFNEPYPLDLEKDIVSRRRRRPADG